MAQNQNNPAIFTYGDQKFKYEEYLLEDNILYAIGQIVESKARLLKEGFDFLQKKYETEKLFQRVKDHFSPTWKTPEVFLSWLKKMSSLKIPKQITEEFKLSEKDQKVFLLNWVKSKGFTKNEIVNAFDIDEFVYLELQRNGHILKDFPGASSLVSPIPLLVRISNGRHYLKTYQIKEMKDLIDAFYQILEPGPEYLMLSKNGMELMKKGFDFNELIFEIMNDGYSEIFFKTKQEVMDWIDNLGRISLDKIFSSENMKERALCNPEQFGYSKEEVKSFTKANM